MNFSPHPILVLAMLGLVATVIMLVTVFRVRHWGLKVLLAMIAVVTLVPAVLVGWVMFPEALDARFQTYKDFYAHIQLGMTRAEIMALEDRLYPADGPRKKPTVIMEDDTSLTFFMHPEDSTEPNCEGIFLGFAEGKLKSKNYSPD